MELNNAIKRYDDNRRNSRLDESLDQFKKFYNETLENVLIKFPSTTKDQSKPFISPDFLLNLMRKKESYDLLLQQNLVQNWELILRMTLDNSKLAESNSKSALMEFTKFQEDLALKAKNIASQTQASLTKQLIKSGVRNEREQVNERLKRLESEITSSRVWKILELQKQQAELLLNNLKDRIQITNSTYDELISKRKVIMYNNYMNDVTLNKILKLVDPNDVGWTKIRSEDGINVYRKFMGMGPGFQYACVRCGAVINASLSNVYNLFDDDSRIREYNSFYERGKDIEVFNDNTRIVWSASPPVFPFKARDFCTVIHTRKLKDGTIVILNRATTHSDAPPTSKYVRASVIFGANILQPVENSSNKCKLTMITQVDPGGFTPPMIINHVSFLFKHHILSLTLIMKQISTLGPVGFLKNVEAAAKKKVRKTRRIQRVIT